MRLPPLTSPPRTGAVGVRLAKLQQIFRPLPRRSRWAVQDRRDTGRKQEPPRRALGARAAGGSRMGEPQGQGRAGPQGVVSRVAHNPHDTGGRVG